ncbi:calmodulin-binding protein 60 E [Artemisia annua]|uniref:Calmodulin-binding protein 60 E n=1 Tax=Artemisia annua TaxID=35608 RepID=A0A2U1N6K1_ARTAN|nr:calmodulin-binding protein 60 E [Artemisia annua]
MERMSGYCLKVASGYCFGFAVKDHRGELYKKHYPPALHGEVWRLDRIAKDGALHKKLMKSEVITVEDSLRVLARDPQRFKNEESYMYTMPIYLTPLVLSSTIYELRGLTTDGQFVPLESLSHNQKLLVDSLVKRAYENWNRVIEYDTKVTTDWSDPQGHGFGGSFSEEVHLRGSKMLQTDDMLKLLRNFGVGAPPDLLTISMTMIHAVITFLMSQRWAKCTHKGPSAVQERQLLVGSN